MNRGIHSRKPSGAWRVAAAFVSLGMLAWGLAGVVYLGATGAHAEADPHFRDVESVLLVPQDGEWYYVKIGFFMFDDGSGTFETDAATARAEMAGRFPGAIEVTEDSAHAAYILSGFKWMANGTSWAYNNSGAPGGLSAQPAMQAAAATWGQQGANFSFSGGGSTANGTGACGGGTDGSNTVGWGPQSGSVLAVTCSWYGSSGNPRPAVEFDMQFDPDWSWTTGSPIQVDVQSVALHEFGHALGLNHSASGGAVMFASYSQGSNKRTPAQDDIDGLVAIYGGQGGGQPTATNTPANTPTPANTATPTNTPGGSPTQGGGSPTPPLATSTPTKTPTPGGGGGNPTQPPLPTSTPTKTPVPGSPTAPLATTTPTASATAPGAATATPTKSPTPGNSLPIVPGANFLAWPGADAPPAQALAGVVNIRVVYAYDPATGKWTRYLPGAPGFLNNLTLLKKGGAYWFIASGSTQVSFQP